MKVAAIVLAAGLSSRMAKGNKLLADLGGKPVLRHTLDNVLASQADPVVVVTGHQAGDVEKLIQGLPVKPCYNPQFAEGMATSLAAGIAGLPLDVAAALIFLGDMPLIGGDVIDQIIDGFDPGKGKTIVVPVHGGRRGHPVLWGRAHFADLVALKGDQGARQLLSGHAGEIAECDAGSDAIFADADTPEALARLRARIATAL
ncbi:MAG: nucleotidyltransferase family protein [Rhizobiales bacterium]|nr:nucleotidyltransferase family protein [Hyphomicrobiales bacterium]